MKKYSIILFLLLHVFTFVSPVLAQTATTPNQGLGCGGGFGPIADMFCNPAASPEVTSQETGQRLNKMMGSIVGFLTIIAALWFFIQFILAGYAWISAGADTEKTAAAWSKITNAIIGLVIVVAAWVIVGLIGKLIGLDILNPGQAIQNLGI